MELLLFAKKRRQGGARRSFLLSDHMNFCYHREKKEGLNDIFREDGQVCFPQVPAEDFLQRRNASSLRKC